MRVNIHRKLNPCGVMRFPAGHDLLTLAYIYARARAFSSRGIPGVHPARHETMSRMGREVIVVHATLTSGRMRPLPCLP